ncbi:MAG: hypothetical protein NDI90_04295 [Nitrospira sp. BO4]|jgi:hypothetical protein|nr:hypothetical protein [Nitrospira sp. BO4]
MNLLDQLINGSSSPLQKFNLTCEPVTMAMGGMSLASAGMNIYGQFQARDTHNQTEEYRRLEQENVIEENRRRATHDYLTNTRLEQQQEDQEKAALAQKVVDLQMQADRSIATGIASAAERGVAGRTVDQIVSDFDFMANEESGRLKENQKLASLQHGENIRSLGTEYSNRIAAVKPYVKQPAKPIDFFGPIFQAGAQTLSTDVAVSRANPTANTFTNWASKPSTPTAGTQRYNPLSGFPSVGV